MSALGFCRDNGISRDNQVPEPNADFMVCMSVVEDGPRIAFAAYNEQSNQIILEKCIADGYEMQALAERVLTTIRPTLVLLSNKIITNDTLLEVLTTLPSNPTAESDDESDDGDQNNVNTGCSDLNNPLKQKRVNTRDGNASPRTIPYRLMKTSSFDIRACRSIILKLRVASLMTSSSQRSRMNGHTRQDEMLRSFPLSRPCHNERNFKVSSYHSLASIVDFDSSVQIQALGSLLSFLQSTLFRLEEGGYIPINDIICARSSNHMHVSAETMSSLHIFATEHHPIAAAKGYGNSKEGFSLFSLLDRTKSRAGRQRLREWMMKPLQTVEEISLRHDGVELFNTLPDMQRPAGSILSLLDRVGAVDKVLVRIQKCCAKPNDFLVLTKALSSAVAIVSILQDEVLQRLLITETSVSVPDRHLGYHSELHPRIQRYVEFTNTILGGCHIRELCNLFDRITSIVDEEATFECKAIVIRPGHHEQLDACKMQFAQLKETLSCVGTSLAQRLPHLRNYLQVIFIPQVGFLVALDSQVNWSEEGTIPDDFVFVFTEGDKSFFKNIDVRSLDENIGDLDSYIKDTESLILAELEEEILDFEKEIRKTISAIADLDCILAFAACAADLGYVRPEVVARDDNCIEIVKGRHPLQEILMENNFRPNNTSIVHANRVNVITGPNFSGKSCYARQVGLLVFMAHIGCFIPCEQATISITDQIIARFSNGETCAVPQSSFQLALTQMGQSLRLGTSYSLVIIDEFGKGTCPSSGIALLTAALKILARSNCKVICTTHFLEMFSMNLIQDGENGMKAMQMVVQISGSSADEMEPLFMLEDGVASSSAGLACARKAGVKEAVLERANELVQALKGRRKVQPLVEILRKSLDLSHESKDFLDAFVSKGWIDATDSEVDLFLSTIQHE